MSNEPYKWELNPEATLREFVQGRHDEFGAISTICGVHRHLWLLLNVDCNGLLPQSKLDELNRVLETAFRMGKRMDYRLRKNFIELHGVTPEEAAVNSMVGKFVEEVDFPPKESSGAKKYPHSKGKKGTK